jgi:hypothetical protein
MTTGIKPRIKGGVKLDKSGKRLVFDPKSLDVSKRLQKQGKQKVKYGRRGGK